MNLSDLFLTKVIVSSDYQRDRKVVKIVERLSRLRNVPAGRFLLQERYFAYQTTEYQLKDEAELCSVCVHKRSKEHCPNCFLDNEFVPTLNWRAYK